MTEGMHPVLDASPHVCVCVCARVRVCHAEYDILSLPSPLGMSMVMLTGFCPACSPNSHSLSTSWTVADDSVRDSSDVRMRVASVKSSTSCVVRSSWSGVVWIMVSLGM